MVTNSPVVGLVVAVLFALGGLIIFGLPTLWLASKFARRNDWARKERLKRSVFLSNSAWGNKFAHAFSLALIVLLGTSYMRLNRAIDSQALLFHGLSVAVAPAADMLGADSQLMLIRKESKVIAQEAADRPRLFGPLQACLDWSSCSDLSAEFKPK